MSALLLLLACTPSAPTEQVDDARRLPLILEAGDAARCAELSDPELLGHCQQALGVACEQITPGQWQHECYFARAEAKQPREDAARVQDCMRSGPFADDCFKHLMKAALNPLLEASPQSPDAAALTAQAEALVAQWAKLGARDWSPPWGWWWRRIHQISTPLDRGICDTVPAQHRRSCQREAVAMLRLAWGRALPERPELCRLEGEALRAQVEGDPDLAWVANPDLDEVVRLELESGCR